jgi:hypothetical protein
VESEALALADDGTAAGYVLAADGRARPAVWRLGPPDTLVLLPLPAGAVEAEARAVNAEGMVAGVAVMPTPAGTRERAVRWRNQRPVRMAGGSGGEPRAVPPGRIPELLPDAVLAAAATAYGTRAPLHSRAGAVNARGEVAGVHGPERGPWRPFVWRGDAVAWLAVPDAGTAEVVGLSDRGAVAGTVTPASGPDARTSQAVVWRAGSAERLFGGAPGSGSVAHGATPGGLIVGEVATAYRAQGSRAFAWSPDGVVDTAVRAPAPAARRVRYTAANDRGARTGVRGDGLAFVRRGDRDQPLAPLAGFDDVTPRGLNAAGAVVGVASAPSAGRAAGDGPGIPGRYVRTHAVAWDSAGRVRALPLTPAPACGAVTTGR